MERTLVQYFVRMCDRCTPFGLFAGVSVGVIGNETRLRLAGRERYRRRSTLDLAQVGSLVRQLRADEGIRGQVRYRPNDTLATVPGGYQYVEASERNGKMQHEVAFLESDEALEVVLAGAADGAALSTLSGALAAALTVPDVTNAEIAEYLDDLIEGQVIQPELIPAVVGPDPLDQILSVLEASPLPAEAVSPTRRLRQTLDKLDSHGVGAPRAAYEAVEEVWTGALEQEKTDRLLQVDLFKEAENLRLSEEVVKEVLQGAEPLWRLSGPVQDELGELKNRFRERYESREVPLGEAFDPERGLGVPAPDLRPLVPMPPLLRKLQLGGEEEDQRDKVLAEVLDSRLTDFADPRDTVLELDDDLLDRLAPRDTPPLPGALSLHFELLAESEEAVRRGDYRILLHGMAGPSGVRMLGRFCDLDSELLEGVRRHLLEEAALAPGEIYAEIVHTPEGRLGNVVRRPHVGKVELSVAGHSRFWGESRLTVDDLLLSLPGTHFRLRSRRDGRVVRPRLTSAHNYSLSSGLYRFLCALQADGVKAGCYWSWGALNGLKFLPRATRGRAIYALARWRTNVSDSIYRAVGSASGRIARERAVGQLVEHLRLPRFVRLADLDNRLLLDLENSLCRRVLADHTARRSGLTLEEVLDEDLEGCVSGPEGKFRNEFVLPLVRRERPTPEGGSGRPRSSRSTARDVNRLFTPGSEWLYFKLYCGPSSTDRLIREVVAPVAALHGELEPDQPWFFIRYADPEHHLRVRFRARREARHRLNERMTSLVEPMVGHCSIHRVCLDTYVQEVERYGGSVGVARAEDWFRQDSEAVLRLLSILEGAENENLRWQATAMGFDRLLSDFRLGLADRERVMRGGREEFGAEFTVSPQTRRQLARRLRGERSILESIVAGVSSGKLEEIEGVFRERSEKSSATVNRFLELNASGDLTCSLHELLRSMTHMHANRLFASRARAQELVIHDFLSRTYRSLLARRSG